jgi:hypothetical protein
MAKMTVQSILLTERVRISKILESPEGRARPKLATELALRSPMDATAAIQLLQAAPTESNTAEASFLKALAGETIGLSAVGAEVITDKKEKRLAEIRQNVRRTKGAA